MLLNSLNSFSIKQIAFKGKPATDNQATPKTAGLVCDTFTPNKNRPCVQKGQITDEHGNILNKHTTSMFRSDINWPELSSYLKEKYKNEQKVNCYQYGSSDGRETYSLVMLLDDNLEKDAGKFFPVKAMDISSEMVDNNIAKQKANDVKIDYNDYAGCYSTLHFSFRPEKIDKYIDETDKGFKLKETVTGNVRFNHANMLEDINNLDEKSPSVVLCRNMWQYIDPKEYVPYAERLYDKLHPNSCIIIGDCETRCEPSIARILTDAGFTPADKNISTCGNTLIFEKN